MSNKLPGSAAREAAEQERRHQFGVRKLSMEDLIDAALECSTFVVDTAPNENTRERLIEAQEHLQAARRLSRSV